MILTHERTGTTFMAPDGWEVVSPEEPGGAALVLAAVEPAGAEQQFRANLVLSAVPNAGVGYDDWQGASELLLGQQLRDYWLLDREELRAGERPLGRRLAHYTADNGDALVLEQWCAVVDDVGITLTATVDALRYPDVAAQIDECGASLRLPETISPLPPESA